MHGNPLTDGLDLLLDGRVYRATAAAMGFVNSLALRDQPVLLEPSEWETRQGFGCTLEQLVRWTLEQGWFEPADCLVSLKKALTVDQVKAELQARGLKAPRKKIDMLQALAQADPAWVQAEWQRRPAYYWTAKGEEALGVMRRAMNEDYKATHREAMLGYLARDVAQAREQAFILGFEVVARTDWPCPRSAALAGVYLPDELPDLYPADCPHDMACACILAEMVLASDRTPQAGTLRQRLATLGRPVEPLRPEAPPMRPEQIAEVRLEVDALYEQATTPESRSLWAFCKSIFK